MIIATLLYVFPGNSTARAKWKIARRGIESVRVVKSRLQQCYCIFYGELINDSAVAVVVF